ncbi:MAG: hypothetical protein HY077_16940 [Elusimicrobia bacterium]|nr:hypothetical protein [Elusimicrobiota bacterium]
MAKKSKPKKSNGGKPQGESAQASQPTTQRLREPRLIRAIAVTPDVLEAAKAYKRDKKVSFYQLGLSAISEVLKREGYLKTADA